MKCRTLSQLITLTVLYNCTAIHLAKVLHNLTKLPQHKDTVQNKTGSQFW